MRVIHILMSKPTNVSLSFLLHPSIFGGTLNLNRALILNFKNPHFLPKKKQNVALVEFICIPLFWAQYAKQLTIFLQEMVENHRLLLSAGHDYNSQAMQ